MQDRLKFRMFNKLIKKFSYFSSLDLQVCLNGDFKSGLIFSMDETIEDNGIYMGPYKEIQFCTGLKDKTGKLIFEGDVVKVGDDIYQIVYEIGSFMLTAKDEKVINKFKDNWNDNVYPLSQFYFNNENENNYINEVEIIGNIYENPEHIENRAIRNLSDEEFEDTYGISRWELVFNRKHSKY